MSADIYTESREIGYAILWGLELAFFYDGLNILRNVMRHKEIFIYLEDFIYWLSAALFVFDRLYKIGNGQIRWYMALGVGIGMLFYKLTVSKMARKRRILYPSKNLVDSWKNLVGFRAAA